MRQINGCLERVTQKKESWGRDNQWPGRKRHAGRTRQEITAYNGNIGRFNVGKVKAMLEHFLEYIRKREEDFDKKEATEKV